MVRVYPHGDDAGNSWHPGTWYTFLCDLPQSMTVLKIKTLLERKLVGKIFRFRRNNQFAFGAASVAQVIPVPSQDLRLQGIPLVNIETTADTLGFDDMEMLDCR